MFSKTVPVTKPPSVSAPKSAKLPKNLTRNRLQACGTHNLEKTIENVRQKSKDAHITVLSLSWRVRTTTADTFSVMNEAGNTAYETRANQTVLGYSEFVGFSCARGVGETAASLLASSENNHVIIVDGTKAGKDFSRLCACLGGAFLALKTKRVVKTALPESSLLSDAIKVAVECESVESLRTTMCDYYNEKMYDTMEPLVDAATPKRQKKTEPL